MGHLISPEQPSYAWFDLLVAAGSTYWPAFVVSGLSLLEGPAKRIGRLGASVSPCLPFLAWALVSNADLRAAFGLSPSYVLWHRLTVSVVALAFVVAVLSILWSGAWFARRRTLVWPNPLWCVAVVCAPLADWALVVFFSSPIDAVFKP